MITVTRKFTFEAAHHLPDYDGPCRYIHGHSYKLFVEVTDDIGTFYPEMMVDFSELKAIVEKNIIEKMDHKYLNDQFKYPTVEKIVGATAKKLNKLFGEGLVSVTLYETENCFATWRKDPK